MERARGSTGDGSTAGRTELARFEAFYDFAFLRVHRFAIKRIKAMAAMRDRDVEIEAQALTELILDSALTSFGGARAPVDGLRVDPAELAFQIFAIAHRVAVQVEEDPSLLSQVSVRSQSGEPVFSKSSLLTHRTHRTVASRKPAPPKQS